MSSVEPLSATTSSQSPVYVCAAKAASCPPTVSAALRVGITTLTERGDDLIYGRAAG